MNKELMKGIKMRLSSILDEIFIYQLCKRVDKSINITHNIFHSIWSLDYSAWKIMYWSNIACV